MLVSLFLISGCVSVLHNSYNTSLTEASFAAKEALTAVGCDQISPRSSHSLEGYRKLLIGFFVGQGNETFMVNLKESGQTTEATIETKKKFVGFLAQRNMNLRIAQYIEEFAEENKRVKE